MGPIIIASTTVHTTGINWQSVLTIIVSIVTLLGILGAVVGKYIANKITTAIGRFQDAVVDKLDNRLTVVETKLDFISQNNPKRNT